MKKWRRPIKIRKFKFRAKEELKAANPMCKGKYCHDKRGAVSAMNKRKKQGVKNLRIYPCPKCNMWHLTHTEQRESP